MVRSAREWRWSSYRTTAGKTSGPDCLHSEWILSAFAKRKSVAVEQYKQFVSEGKGQPSPWASVQNQVYLGSERFAEQMQSGIDKSKKLSEVPLLQRRPKPKKLSYYEKSSSNRNSAMSRAYRSGGYTLQNSKLPPKIISPISPN